MKKAKIILSCVFLLAVIGGALAFKANMMPRNVYTLSTGSKVASCTVGGIVYTTTIPNCTFLPLRTTPGIGVSAIVSSTTTSPLVTSRFISAGHPDVICTYVYCTTWNTRVVDSND